jgi:hypothetical protein
MLAQLHLIIASKFIKSFNLSPNDFLFSINSGPKNAMIASPCIYEIKPLQVIRQCETSLLNAPSSSRILEVIVLAIN